MICLFYHDNQVIFFCTFYIKQYWQELKESCQLFYLKKIEYEMIVFFRKFVVQ